MKDNHFANHNRQTARMRQSLAPPDGSILATHMYNLFGGVMQLNRTANFSNINFLTPGMILITAIYGTASAALRINADIRQDIVARFRSMSISRSSVLNGHVADNAIGSLMSLTAIIALSYMMGFRSSASVVDWLAALVLIVLFVTAIMWLTIAIGVGSKTPEAANGILYLIYILPFFSSAFVPASSMTPVVSPGSPRTNHLPRYRYTARPAAGRPNGQPGAYGCCLVLGIGLIGYLWSRVAYNYSTNQ